MKAAFMIFLLMTATLAAAEDALANFAGKWKFYPAQSKNVGMMAQASIDTVITQSKAEIVVDEVSSFDGQKDTQHTVYDLRGKPVANTSMMAGPAMTRSHWEGSHLITEWEGSGAIAGTMNTRVETRYLSPDGKIMYVESARRGQEAMVIVYTRAR